jgi:hypothetical protein
MNQNQLDNHTYQSHTTTQDGVTLTRGGIVFCKLCGAAGEGLFAERCVTRMLRQSVEHEANQP